MDAIAPIPSSGVRWSLGVDIDGARLATLIAAANAALAAGAVDRKGSRRKQSFLLALEGGVPEYLLKVNHYASLPPWRRLQRSKARVELDRATTLAARGVATLIPVAAGELRTRGLLDRCYGLVRWLPDASDLLAVWTEARGDAASRRAWTRELGTLVRRMHDAGVHQEDLAPNNFLWRTAREPRLLAIDFERARVGRRVSARERVFALAKLDRHFAGAPRGARMRLLGAYANGSRDEARQWARDVAAFAPQLFRRDLAHWKRTATRSGRRFEPVEVASANAVWRGFSRRGAPLESIRGELEAEPSNTPLRIPNGSLLCPIAIADSRDAAHAWALAQTLFQRRLMPEPIALLYRSGAAVLAFADADDLVLSADAPIAARRAQLVVYADRMLGLGIDVGALRFDTLAFSRRHRRVLLLDPMRSVLGRRVAGDRASARRRVAELLD